ncbi:UvrD-helicase domain-containing protein [Butyrivibrio sp. AE3004]|uniref:UvrD-helicase domain-containing protein n=1 Tax=Butyrivibrio sp. AE3004 TaxID=1506994 RepID=UPI0004943847|nr:UvrD-helicase domain-containing protein [Butyrivibrio sp. AE3004]
MNYSEVVFSQYKNDGRVMLVANDAKVAKRYDSINYQLSEQYKFERTENIYLKDGDSSTIRSGLQLAVLVSDGNNADLTFPDGQKELEELFNTVQVIKIFYYGFLGKIEDCKWAFTGEDENKKLDILLGNSHIKYSFVNINIEDDAGDNIKVLNGYKYVEADIPEELRGSDIVLNKSISSGEEFNKEKKKLGKVVFAIKDKISEIESGPHFVNKYEVIKGGDDGTEMAQLNYDKRVSASDYKKIEELDELSRSPYRYRVDLKNNGNPLVFYLGPVEVKDLGSGNEILSFYSEMGKRLATYNAKDRSINNDISLRREFNISRSVLHDFKNIIGTDAGLEGEFREGLVDPFLINIFKQRRAERQIKDIVLTIQENQNNIVDVPSGENVIVQGCAGSGKTMVMMHRLSKLHNWDRAYDSSDAVIIGPSKQYREFMRGLTEGLAISSLSQNTIEGYYLELIGEISKEFVINKSIRTENDISEAFLSYIYSEEMLKNIDLELILLRQDQDEFCERLNTVLESFGEKEISNSYELYDFQNYLADTTTIIKERIAKSKDALTRLRERVNNLKQRYFDLADHEIKKAKEDYLGELKEAVKKVRRILKDEQDSDNRAVIRELLSTDVDNMSEDACKYYLLRAARFSVDANRELRICERTERNILELENELEEKPKTIQEAEEELKKAELQQISSDKEAEVSGILEEAKEYRNLKTYNRIVGNLLNEKAKELGIKRPKGFHRYDLYLRLQYVMRLYQKMPSIHKYICIDEGQDISFMEYQMLASLGKGKSVFNIYGDTNQVLNHGHGLNDWRSLKKLFEYKQFYLDENYRNSNQITHYCNNEFSLSMKEIGIDSAPVRTLSRTEFEFEITTTDKGAKDRWAILLAREYNKKRFAETLPINNTSIDEIGEERISVMYVDEVRGFEFDKVYVIRNGMSSNMEYVSYTRAINELVIVDWK